MSHHTPAKPSVVFRLRQLIWPSMGWKRFSRLTITRLARMKGGDKAIARGFATGAAISMTPFVGLHFILAAVIAKLIRSNVFAGLLGTMLGNPWTFAFIWPASYKLGRHLLNVPRDRQFDLTQLDLTTLMDNFNNIFIPMLIGSIPLAIITWASIYWIMLRSLKLFHDRRAKSRNDKLLKRYNAQNSLNNNNELGPKG